MFFGEEELVSRRELVAFPDDAADDVWPGDEIPSRRAKECKKDKICDGAQSLRQSIDIGGGNR